MSVAGVKELRERTGLGMMECKKALVAADNDIEKAIVALRQSSGVQAAGKAGRIAAEGMVAVRLAEDGSYAVMVEVNSETDFVARDENFRGFVGSVLDAACAGRQTDVAALPGNLETARRELVQKVGENIAVRRLAALDGAAAVVGSYVHSNDRIAALVQLRGGDIELAKEVAMHVAALDPQVIEPDDMPAERVAQEQAIFAAQARQSGKPAAIMDKMVAGRIKKFLAENSLLEQAFVRQPERTVGQLLADADAEICAFVRYEVGEGIEKGELDFAAEVAAQL